MAGKSELTDWKSRVDQYKAIINQLETDKMMLQQQLQQQVSDLKSKLDEQGSTFTSQVALIVNIKKNLTFLYRLSPKIMKF